MDFSLFILAAGGICNALMHKMPNDFPFALQNYTFIMPYCGSPPKKMHLVQNKPMKHPITK